MLSTKLRGFLAEIQAEKSAAATRKQGAAYNEPGSIGGPTSHPVKDVDDGTQKATEGARSAENSADVKEQEMAGNVDSAADKGPDQESVQFNVGVTSTETGKDPANENNYKGDKDDPGTSHPAKTDDGEKYASMSFAQIKALFEKKANAVMAGLAAGGTRPTAPAPAKTAGTAPAPAQTTAEKAAALKAAQAGYDLAAKAGQQKTAAAEKAATEQAVEQTIRSALAMATMTGNYLRTYEKQALAKLAGDDEGGEGGEGGEKKEKKDSDDSGGGEKKKPGGESGGDSSGGDPSGGGAIPGADAGLLGDMAGGGGGGGGAPGGDPAGGGAPGGGNQSDAIQQILMALMEMGITPDQILAQLQGGGGGGGGGAPGGPPPGGDPMAAMGGGGPPPGGDPMAALGGGGPPPGGDPMAGGDPTKMAARKTAAAQKRQRDLVELMKTAKAFQRSGRFQVAEAKTAAERKLRNEIKKCFAEIVG